MIPVRSALMALALAGAAAPAVAQLPTPPSGPLVQTGRGPSVMRAPLREGKFFKGKFHRPGHWRGGRGFQIRRWSDKGWRGHRRWRGGGDDFAGIGVIGGDWWNEGSIYEENRTAMGNGFFGSGSNDGGYYAYDRGYPYDHYEEAEEWEDVPAPRRPARCTIEHDVRVCRG